MTDPMEILDQLGAQWSPDLEAYAAGETDSPRCVLCLRSPCACPEFGSDEYYALLDQRHGTGERGTPSVTNRDGIHQSGRPTPANPGDPTEGVPMRGSVT